MTKISQESIDFPRYISRIHEKVMISLHTLKNLTFGASKVHALIEGGISLREFEGEIGNRRQGSLISCGHSMILGKSCDFAAYIQKLCFWGIKNQHPYRRCVVEWPFRRENSRVRSPILDRGVEFFYSEQLIHTHAHHLPLSHRDGSRHGN